MRSTSKVDRNEVAAKVLADTYEAKADALYADMTVSARAFSETPEDRLAIAKRALEILAERAKKA